MECYKLNKRAYAPKIKRLYLKQDITFFNCIGQFSYSTSLSGGDSPVFINHPSFTTIIALAYVFLVAVAWLLHSFLVGIE